MSVMKAAVKGVMTEGAVIASDLNTWLRITVVMAVPSSMPENTPAVTVPFTLIARPVPNSLPMWCHPRTLLLLNLLRHKNI